MTCCLGGVGGGDLSPTREVTKGSNQGMLSAPWEEASPAGEAAAL